MPFRDASSSPLHFVEDSNSIADALRASDSSSSVLDRYKNTDSSILSNYPLIARASSISNYVHLVNPKQVQFDQNMGYSQVWTRMGDMGGTVFSDSLIHAVHSIAATDLSDDLYELKKRTGNYSLYSNRYTYPLGILLNRDSTDSAMLTSRDPFQNQNIISKSVTGTSLLDILISGENSASYHLSNESRGILYFYGTDIQNSIISVNGSPILIPTKDDLHNYLYPTPDLYHNGIVELGVFDRGPLDIRIDGEFSVASKIYIAVCPLDRFESHFPTISSNFNYTAGKNTLQITLDNKTNGPNILLLPLYAADGWKCRVNGKTTEIKTLWNFFMGIPVSEHFNSIELSFMPPGFQLGVFMSFLGIAGMILCTFLKQAAADYRMIKILSDISWRLFIVLESIFFILVYLVPLLFFFPANFMR